ncbi:MAG: toxin-antitoxin system HicB family antitoxin [Microthrixaceae bacterium]|nr:toxin-antitoxin system HicB family antitoxin [Acidimicrobiales bacterium]MCB9403185.1 toxin-antitoxin system HicB family antitoxin [Microthrixaceae bacterium]
MTRPRIYDEPRVPTAIRLPATLHQRLHAIAAERDVSANLLVTRAVESYLDHLTPLDHASALDAPEIPA